MSMTVTVSKHIADLVEEKVASGLFGSASEVIEAAVGYFVSHDEEATAKLAWLRQAVQEGLDSGEDIPWNPEEIKRLARQMRENGEI